MPEGPQVRKLAKIIEGYAGKQLVSIKPVPKSVTLELPAVIERVTVKGKNMFIHLDGGRILYNHLLMWGWWLPYCKPSGENYRGEGRNLKYCFKFNDGSELGYYGGGILKTMSADEMAAKLASLGPDVMEAANAEEAFKKVRPQTVPIGEALLHQEWISGIGNIYKSEGLFAVRTHPKTPAGEIGEETYAKLFAWLQRQMLADVTRSGPITTTTAELSRRGINSFVYRRAGQPCLICGTKISRIVQEPNKRSTYFCPHCQPQAES